MKLLFFFFLLVVVAHTTDVKGAISLDSFTFDKLVGGFFDVLVKFDKQYPYGDKEDAWKDLSGSIGQLNLPELLLGQVGVQDYGDKLNEDLRERFDVKADDFPVHLLFRKGSTTPMKFSGEVTHEAMSRFLVSELGVYIGLPGCIEALDKIANGYLAATSEERTKLMSQAEAIVADQKSDADQNSAKFYINVMKKVNEKGSEYPLQEKARLEKLVQSKITEEKKKAMKNKLNILPSFK